MGLYHFNRLPFGVASAPAIFRRTMETLLHGLRGVSIYLDDILITGATVVSTWRIWKEFWNAWLKHGYVSTKISAPLINGKRPIAFMSRTLKRNIHSWKRRACYRLCSHEVSYMVNPLPLVLTTNHYYFSWGIPVMASLRIQWWALTLSAYQYIISYKSRKTLQHADAFIWLPLVVTCDHDGLPGDVVHLMDHLSTTPISCANGLTGTQFFLKLNAMSCKVSFHWAG